MRFGLILLILLFEVAGAVFGALNSQDLAINLYIGSVARQGRGTVFPLLAGCWAGCWSI